MRSTLRSPPNSNDMNSSSRLDRLPSALRLCGSAFYYPRRSEYELPNIIEAPERALLSAVYGSLRSSPAPPDWRHDAFSQAERHVNVTMEQFTAAGISLVEGIAMRRSFNDQITMIDRPTGPGGTIEKWSLFAMAFEALFIGFREPIDPTTPFADLTAY